MSKTSKITKARKRITELEREIEALRRASSMPPFSPSPIQVQNTRIDILHAYIEVNECEFDRFRLKDGYREYLIKRLAKAYLDSPDFLSEFVRQVDMDNAERIDGKVRIRSTIRVVHKQ